ncbi:hypothetical protein GCM10023310_68770 [Paenibacillus vulneris]|uniref:Lipoprotein n=1 Tax=Paenibacillus vulneris TaxID=1133364 RepID=A0ABW3UJH0_9BACL
MNKYSSFFKSFIFTSLFILVFAGCAEKQIPNTKTAAPPDYLTLSNQYMVEISGILTSANQIFKDGKSSERWKSEIQLMNARIDKLQKSVDEMSVPEQYKESHTYLKRSVKNLKESQPLFQDVIIDGKAGIAVLGTFLNMASEDAQTFQNKLKLINIK